MNDYKLVAAATIQRNKGFGNCVHVTLRRQIN